MIVFPWKEPGMKIPSGQGTVEIGSKYLEESLRHLPLFEITLSVCLSAVPRLKSRATCKGGPAELSAIFGRKRGGKPRQFFPQRLSIGRKWSSKIEMNCE